MVEAEIKYDHGWLMDFDPMFTCCYSPLPWF